MSPSVQQYNVLYQPPPTLDPNSHYPHDTSGYYSAAASHNYSSVDMRPSFGHSSFSAAMEHTPRTAALPQPLNHHMNSREQYTLATPLFRRQSEHPSQLPLSLGGAHLRRHLFSNSPSNSVAAIQGSSMDVDSQFRGGPPAEKPCPKFGPATTYGELRYQDECKTPCDVTLSGSMSKFFMSENAWTCYRRNYFACTCSFSLAPYYGKVPLELKMNGAHHYSRVQGFAVGISGAVALSKDQTIALVQHTPKRDKGPIVTPPKIALMAKGTHKCHIVYNTEKKKLEGIPFPDGWVPSESGGHVPRTEWAYERMQFKQATQNNGKRRAAQQYYHLVIELWANIGTVDAPNYQKIIQRMSERVIVRGRSPGHYQNERSRTNKAAATSTARQTPYSAPVEPPRVFDTPQLQTFNGYDTSHGLYEANQRHHSNHQPQHDNMHRETMVPTDDDKVMSGTRSYNYYSGTVENNYHSNGTIEPWVSQQGDHQLAHMLAGVDINGKVKHESENNTLPRLVHPSSLNNTEQTRCSRPYEGRPPSTGSYPQLLSPSSMNMAL